MHLRNKTCSSKKEAWRPLQAVENISAAIFMFIDYISVRRSLCIL